MNTTALLVPQDGMMILDEAKRAEITAQVNDAEQAAKAARDSALAITEITDETTFNIASAELRDLAGTARKLEERRKSITRPMDDAKSFVMRLFDGPGKYITEGEAHLRKLVKAHMDEQARQEAIRRAEVAAAAERERKAAEERRLAAELDQAHAEAILENLNFDRERAIATGDHEKMDALDDAEAAAVMDVEMAAADAQDAIEAEQTAEITTRAVAAPAPKARGVGTSSKWVVESFDKQAMIAAAAKDPALAMYLVVDEQKLRQYVTMMKAEAKVPGVVFAQESQLRVRRS